MRSDSPTLQAPKRIEVFGFDVAEISQIRRIRALAALGHQVHSFTMRRENMNKAFEPDWPNTHLFMTENENLQKRVAVVAKSIWTMRRYRKSLATADMIIARNLDMLAIACAARLIAGAPRTPIVYECLDINGALCRNDLKSRLMRAAERFLLRHVQLLVVSSPGFVREYFAPIQNYVGPTALWENKLAAGCHLPARPTQRPLVDRPLRIGWVGTIRCAPSLHILADLADRLGPKVEIRIHGVVHRHALPDFDDVVAARPSMTFCGGYAYPDDLTRVYEDCDVVWAQDLWQRGNNSDWLLPNRIYEASWAGCPSIALADTETGRRIEADDLGWVIPSGDGRALAELLSTLSPSAIQAKGQALLDRPETDFVQSYEEIETVVRQLCSQKKGSIS